MCIHLVDKWKSLHDSSPRIPGKFNDYYNVFIFLSFPFGVSLNVLFVLLFRQHSFLRMPILFCPLLWWWPSHEEDFVPSTAKFLADIEVFSVSLLSADFGHLRRLIRSVWHITSLSSCQQDSSLQLSYYILLFLTIFFSSFQ